MLASAFHIVSRRHCFPLDFRRANAFCRRPLRCLGVWALLLGILQGSAHADPVPSLWDPALHLDKPDLSGLKAIRFLTADDYPPLDFALADGALAGFNVEIARALCEELRLPCTIQARRWDT